MTRSKILGYKPCVVIPCYNHGDKIEVVLKRLQPFQLHVFIVDDGSDERTKSVLSQLSQNYPEVTFYTMPQNQGKGQAVLQGIKLADEAGFTHALQVDADGQHCIEDAPKFLNLSKEFPGALISGQPLYDDSIPKARLYGRYITHFWVWVETLSFSIKDSMCGFRVYPIAPVVQLLKDSLYIGRRMDFDTEIMVRLYWCGIPSLFIPTRVVYPDDGVSHFDAWRDNVQISWMHTRLFFGMLVRIPKLLMRNIFPERIINKAKLQPEHWAHIPERRGMLGMRFMFWVYRVLGRDCFQTFLYPAVAFFYMTGKSQRQASEQFLQRAHTEASRQDVAWDPHVNSFRHMFRFADAMLDKMASWQGKIRWGSDIDWADSCQNRFRFEDKQGCFFLVSHLGDVEVCRALAQHLNHFKINALVFHKNAQRFKQMMDEYAPDASLNLIAVDEVGPQTAVLLQEKIALGENVAIVGDRISVSQQLRGKEQRIIWSNFLGAPAPFAQGPFVLASLLKCPVYLLFALKKQKKIHLYLEKFCDQLVLHRKSRQETLQKTVDEYAKRLEYYSLRYPLEWFNFYNFWELPSMKEELRDENISNK